MKKRWGSGGIAPRIFKLVTRWEWSDSRPGRFAPREGTSTTHWLGDWNWPQSRSGRGGEETKSLPSPPRHRTPVVQPVA